MTMDKVIDAVFEREGDKYGDQHTVPPIDQPTARGGLTLDEVRLFFVSQASTYVPDVAFLQTMDHATARKIVQWSLDKRIYAMGLHRIAYEPLRYHILDFAYNSGNMLAMRWLQRVLRVPTTGILDGATAKVLEFSDPWLVHHAYIAARLEMIDRWTDGDEKNKKYEEGLENRALSFSLLLGTGQ